MMKYAISFPRSNHYSNLSKYRIDMPCELICRININLNAGRKKRSKPVPENQTDANKSMQKQRSG